MIPIDKKFILAGTQSYTLKDGDTIVVKVNNGKEFKYKIPPNWQGAIKITIEGNLTEITPTPTQ